MLQKKCAGIEITEGQTSAPALLTFGQVGAVDNTLCDSGAQAVLFKE